MAIGNVAEVAQAGTVPLGGTDAYCGWLLTSGTTVPPAGAAADRVSVPTDGLPPVTTLTGRVLTQSRQSLHVASDGSQVVLQLV